MLDKKQAQLQVGLTEGDWYTLDRDNENLLALSSYNKEPHGE